MGNSKRFKLGSNNYRQKSVSNDFISAAEKIRRHLQLEENKLHGKNAQEVTFAYVTKYIYENYLKGEPIR